MAEKKCDFCNSIYNTPFSTSRKIGTCPKCLKIFDKLRSKYSVPANSKVSKAVKEKVLPRLGKRSKVKCIDCGNKASVYDHREYLNSLNVVPVCRSCNAKRRQAKEVKNLTVCFFRKNNLKLPSVG